MFRTVVSSAALQGCLRSPYFELSSDVDSPVILVSAFSTNTLHLGTLWYPTSASIMYFTTYNPPGDVDWRGISARGSHCSSLLVGRECMTCSSLKYLIVYLFICLFIYHNSSFAIRFPNIRKDISYQLPVSCHSDSSVAHVHPERRERMMTPPPLRGGGVSSYTYMKKNFVVEQFWAQFWNPQTQIRLFLLLDESVY